MRKTMNVVIAAALAAAWPSAARAGSSSSNDWQKAAPSVSVTYYEKGKAHAKAGRYKEAESALLQALAEDPANPDVLNLLAFSERKQGKLEDAFAHYDRALAIRPRFPEAREYLGEAHVQAALQQIDTLRSYGPEGKESLEELIEALKEAAAKLP